MNARNGKVRRKTRDIQISNEVGSMDFNVSVLGEIKDDGSDVGVDRLNLSETGEIKMRKDHLEDLWRGCGASRGSLFDIELDSLAVRRVEDHTLHLSACKGDPLQLDRVGGKVQGLIAPQCL